MKKTILILGFLIFISTPSILKSQIKVKSDGRVYVHGFRAADDYNNECSMQVYGSIGSNLAGGRIAFGDYGSLANGGGNVFIGEYGNTDSDILQLHGKSGIYLTYNTGDILGYYAVSLNRFYFNSDIYSKGVKLLSDERFKKDVSKLNNSLNKLKKINGVSYNLDYNSIDKYFDRNKVLDTNNVTSNNKDVILDNAEKNTAKSKESYKENDKRIGFLAQNLKDNFPELVNVDSSGYYYVDYIGLIPVLVEAIKEQQVIIEDLEARIIAIESNLASNSEMKSNDKSINTSAKLYQNIPNPFTTETSIQYSIPNNSKNAMICVFNLNGNLILTKNISQNGDGSVKIAARELTPGMYLYSLILEGNVIETKRMLLTE